MEFKPIKLPTLSELHYSPEEAFKNDQLNLILNQPPKPSWISHHPTAKKEIINSAGLKVKVPVEYLPIEKVEFLLTYIFQEWRAEVISYSQMFNSVSCHVRLHYKNPLTGLWSYHDGLGAVGVQTDKGASAADLNAIKYDAVMKALPAAKSYAIKDAADHLGSLFGRDLNRKEAMKFSGAYNAPESEIDFSGIGHQLSLISDYESLKRYFDQMPEYHSNKKFQELFQIKNEQITRNGNN